eukprot:TRINITY_DN335_c0_g1_i1.p1 TRINITY_DN335_c0_g1~~TRINITY_DN335_c0_g1_i1.p1  ORF type:complete len:304 (-),score=57.29 TRINITY_DN335_c0_g1_i1:38-949(-)
MGSWWGHAGPGTGFLLVGTFLFLKALNISFLKGLRTRRIWLHMEGFLKFIGGMIGASMEYSDMVKDGRMWSASHTDHITMLLIIAFLGVVDLLQLRGFLKESFWALATPGGFFYIGVMFGSHDQDTWLRGFGHRVNSWLLIFASISRVAEILIASHWNSQHFTTIKKNRTLTSQRRFFHCHSPFSTEISDLYPPATNPIVYKTFFPLLTAFLVQLDGVWWWQMAQGLFVGPMNRDMENGHHGMEMGWGWLTQSVLGTFVAILSFTIALNFLEFLWCRRRGKYSSVSASLEEDDNLEMYKVNIE